MKNILYSILLFISFLFFSCDRSIDSDIEDDLLPPAVPKGLYIYYSGDGLIVLDWQSNSERDLSYYNIYKSSDSLTFTLYDIARGSYYYDDSLSYDSTYFYKISAVDFAERESALSGLVSSMPINLNKPRKPQSVIINGRNWEGEKYFNLKWESNIETDLSHYNVYRNEESNFQTDSISFIGITETNEFNDSSNLEANKTYYYKVAAVDRGGLTSDESNSVSDKILFISEAVFPSDKSNVNYFSSFRFTKVNGSAQYEIVVQENPFYGIFWSKRFIGSSPNDTLSVRFDPPYLSSNKKYYWRIITYTGSQPNSISPLYNFTIKP